MINAPAYGDGRGIAGLIYGAVTFLVPPQCQVRGRLINLVLFSKGSLFMGGFTSFSISINSNLSLIGRKR